MKKLLCMTLTLAMVFALLAGCGGTQTEPPATQAPETQTPATQAPATAEPSDDGEWDFSDAENVDLTFALYLPDGDKTTQILCQFLDMVVEYTEGTVTYTMYANQTLCMADEQLDAVRSGLADITFFPTSYGAGSLPLSYILEMPGVRYNNDRAASLAINEWHKTIDPPELQDFKRLFAYGAGNGGYLTTKPIKVYEDLAGLIIRCAGALAPVLEEYGMIPTVMPISEVYEAIRTGVVDGFTGMLAAGDAYNLQEITSYCALDPFYISAYVFVMNMDIWNSLTPDQQEAVQAAADDAFEEFVSYGRQADAETTLVKFEEAGLEITRFAEEDIKKMEAVNQPRQESYAESVGGAEALELLRELADKYNALYPQN